MGGACRMHVGTKIWCKILVRKNDVKTSLGRHRCRWDDNIKVYLKGKVVRL
jgi:hypothetical protein